MASNNLLALAGIKGWSKIPQIRKISRDRAYTLPVTASGVFLAHGSVAFIIMLAWEVNVNKRSTEKKKSWANRFQLMHYGPQGLSNAKLLEMMIDDGGQVLQGIPHFFQTLGVQ